MTTELVTGVDEPEEGQGGPLLTYALVERALRLSRGNQARTARRLGVTRQAIGLWVKHHPNLRTVIAEARDSLVDLAEDNLRLALINREQWATELTLETLGKGRGFTKRLELTPTTPLPIQVSDADYAMA